MNLACRFITRRGCFAASGATRIAPATVRSVYAKYWDKIWEQSRCYRISLLGPFSKVVTAFLPLQHPLLRGLSTSPEEEAGSAHKELAESATWRPLYLDAQATTPMDPRVLDAMLPYLTSYYGNPHSRTHAYGWESEKAVEDARAKVARLGRILVSYVVAFPGLRLLTLNAILGW